MTATLELAAERGPEGLTMEAIAQRAAVSKETLYRWWRSKAEVVLEALAQYGEEAIPVPNSGLLSTDLQIFMRATSAALDLSTRQLLRALATAAAADATFADTVREHFIARRRAALETVLRQGVQRGELTVELAAAVPDLVFGSLWYRLIFATGPLDQAWADALSDTISVAATPR